MHNVLVSLAALGVLPEFLEIHHYSPKPQITVSPPPRWINANGEQLEWEQLEQVSSPINEIFEISDGYITNNTSSPINVVSFTHTDSSSLDAVF